MHTRDLMKKGQKIEQLALVQAYAEAGNLFDDRERAALAWAETVTRVAQTSVPEHAYQAVRAVFKEKELVISRSRSADERLQPFGYQLPEHTTGGAREVTHGATVAAEGSRLHSRISITPQWR